MTAIALANGCNATMLRKEVMEAERERRLSLLRLPAEAFSAAAAWGAEGFLML